MWFLSEFRKELLEQIHRKKDHRKHLMSILERNYLIYTKISKMLVTVIEHQLFQQD